MSGQVLKHMLATVRLKDGSHLEIMRGAELPGHLAEGELDRLKRLDAVGSPDEVAAILAGPAVAAPEEDEAAAVAAPDLSTLGVMTDEELNALYRAPHPPTIRQIVDAVGADPALARRVLAAEHGATKGEPRVTLVEQLEKVITGAEGGAR